MGGDFDDVKNVGDDVRSLKLEAGEKLETRHLVSYKNAGGKLGRCQRGVSRNLSVC